VVAIVIVVAAPVFLIIYSLPVIPTATVVGVYASASGGLTNN